MSNSTESEQALRSAVNAIVEALRAGRERLPLLPPGKHLTDGLFDREFGAVQHQSILCGLQRGNAAGHVPCVARFQVRTKTVDRSVDSL